MQKLNLSKINQLFSEFRILEDEHLSERINNLKHQVSEFQKSLNPFWKEAQLIKKSEAPYYNIFGILNIRHYETKVHTPFLCNLLNPNANHEQGALFLNSFLKSVLELPYSFIEITNFHIHEEHSVEADGRIDIIITYSIASQRKAIVIENKIWAADQYLQLERYYNYLTKVLKLTEADFKLIYLTPHGTPPSEISISKEEFTRLSQNRVIQQVSYKKDILDWLIKTITEVTSEKIKFSLIQYIQTLSAL